MARILVVEDDENIGTNLISHLRREGFEMVLASSLSEARKRFDSSIDLIILDWMLPDGQGIEWIPKIRTCGRFVPIILLTGRSEMVDKIVGLELGADDYLTKPCEPRELTARIRVQLRHLSDLSNAGDRELSTSPASIIETPPIRMDLHRREVRYKDQLITLAKMEFELLRFFLENPHRVLSRDEILSEIWGFKYPSTRTVDTHVLRLRKKFHSDFFHTVHGSGYCFKPPTPDR